MNFKGKAKRLRIYIGDEVYHKEKPLYRAILEEARKLNIAGGTVFKGLEGYGAHTRLIRANRLFELSSDLPLVVEFVEQEDKLREIGDFLRRTLTKGLVTIEDVEVLGYGVRQTGGDDRVAPDDKKNNDAL